MPRAPLPLTQNLNPYSEALNNAFWTYVGASVTPNAIANPLDGSVTANLVAETNATGAVHTNTGPPSYNPNVTYTLSAYMKDNTRRYAGLRMGVAVGYEATFDLQAGTVTHVSANLTGYGIVPVGNGWYRCWITGSLDAFGSGSMQAPFLSPDGGAYTLYDGSTTKSVYVWGVQLSVSSYPILYSATNGATINPNAAFRKPATRTQNLLTYSEQFDQVAGWSQTHVGVTLAAIVNPVDGAQTGQALVSDATSNSHGLISLQVPTLTITSEYFSISVYAKQADGALPVLLITAPVFPGGSGAYFDLSNGTHADFFAVPLTASMESVGNKWYRCSISGRVPSVPVNTNVNFLVCPAVGNTVYTGDGVSPSMYLYGAQATTLPGTSTYVKSGATQVNPNNSPRTAATGRVPIPVTQNNILQSEAMASAPWQFGTGITVTNNTTDVLDPLGGNTASKVVYDGSGLAGSFMLYQVIGLIGGVINTSACPIAVWVRLATGSVNVNLTSDNLLQTPVAVSTSWVQASQVTVSALPRLLALYRDNSDNTPRTFYVWGGQCAIGKNRLGPYTKTTTTTVLGPIRNAP